MNSKIPIEQTKLWRIPHLDNVELLYATYIKQNFARHAHDGFPLGVVERGAMGYYYRGTNVVAPAGSVAVINPGEPHTGHAADWGWTYRMFYLETSVLEQAAAQIADRPRGVPFFQTEVIWDDELAGLLRHLHCTLELSAVPRLEQETKLLWTLAQLILRHADDPPRPRPANYEDQIIRRVQEFIEDNYAEDISLKQLAALTHFSRYHLLRVFRTVVGMPPHTYLTQVRVNRARQLLAQGQPIAQTALAAGFADQSHLTRQFKRIFGVTPGQFSNSVQDR